MMKILLFLRLLSFDSHKNAKLRVPQMIRDHLRGVLHIKKKTFGRHEPRSRQELFNRSGSGALRVRTANISLLRPAAAVGTI